ASDGGSDIIVTAQKREQKAQDVPVSIAAFSGETIEREGITSVEDLGNSIAGVTIASANPGAMHMTIRGASDLSSSNQSASVNGFYLDETVMSYVPGYMPEVSLLDIERVEVLRGPQGTLFGDGSEGGTLRVITRKPDATDTFGRVKLGVSSTKMGGEGYSAQLNVNVPLVKDVLAVTVAGSYRDLPGWIDIPDISAKDTNTSKLKDGRIALRYTPRDTLTVDAFYQIGRSSIRDFVSTTRGVNNPAAVVPGLGPVGGLSPSEGKLDVAALTVSYDTGPSTLVAASALTTSSYDTTRDLTAVIPAAFPSGLVPDATAQSLYRVRSKAFTQELRLVSNGSNTLNWTVGAFFKHEKREVEEGFVFDVPAIPTVDAPLSHSNQSGDAWALFADLDLALTSKLSLQAGARYFKDNKNFDITQVTGSAFPLGFAPAGTVQTGVDGADALSPKLGLSYKLSDSAMLFAKFSRGFRSGGANTLPISTYTYATSQYQPDSLNSFEVGLKTSLFDGWTANLYVYHNDWHNLQFPFRTNDGVFTYVRNAGKAVSDGAELEVSGNITPSLNVALTYAYSDSAIKGDVSDSFGHLIIASGAELPINSRNKVTAVAHYETDLTGALQLKLDGRYRWASRNFTDPANTAAFANDATSQLYLAAGLAGKWGTVTVYADNVFDRADTLAKYPPAGPPLYILTNYVRPRNVGLEFKRDF
ncbi:MAG: hypothetical protein RLZZ08_1969, partial [Pseudomonadota bacterium]